MTKNTVGAYGAWVRARALAGPGSASFLRFRGAPAAWRRRTRRQVLAALVPPAVSPPRARRERIERWDGVRVEFLSWRLPFGPPTRAVFLTPEGARGRLPAVLAFHCHSGLKHLGWGKIARGRRNPGPVIREFVGRVYGGVFWANALAKRGYAVLVPDGFAFGSRRVRTADVLDRVRGPFPAADPRTPRQVDEYNRWAAGHESVMAKALFAAGTTWPGVVYADDRAALDVLCARPEVDPGRVGCGGLSGGGLRTVLLAGLDPRIKAAVCAGYMTTWRDMAFHQCWTNTWMVHMGALPAVLDFPELLGLRAPAPALVQGTTADPLYDVREQRRAVRHLEAVYRKARAPERFRGTFYPGPHKFDRPMQAEAFAWFDRWLR